MYAKCQQINRTLFETYTIQRTKGSCSQFTCIVLHSEFFHIFTLEIFVVCVCVCKRDFGFCVILNAKCGADNKRKWIMLEGSMELEGLRVRDMGPFLFCLMQLLDPPLRWHSQYRYPFPHSPVSTFRALCECISRSLYCCWLRSRQINQWQRDFIVLVTKILLLYY